MVDASSPPGIVGFVYDRLLGSGGFADVFLYQDLDLRRLVAIKVLRSSIDDAETQAAFVAESQLMAQVSGHPYIVQIYSNGVAADGRPFLVMQYYPGESYAHRIHTKTLSVAETLEVGVQIASALETAHRVGIVHRDVKPSNILTDRYGKPGLTDFGIAGAVSDGSLGFSPPYAAPEVVVDEAAGDVSSDVFSLTATLYALLAGRSPFETADGDNTRTAVTARVLNDDPFPIGRPDVAPMFERLLIQGLSKNPAVRPTSALAFGRSLQAIQQTLHYTPTPLTLEDDQPTPTIPPVGHSEAEQTRHARNIATDRDSTPEPTDSALIREVPNAIDGPGPAPASVETTASDATPDTGSTPTDDHADATLIAPILCANCGAPIGADASYCSHCAHPATPSANAPPADLAPTQDQECPHCAAPIDSTATFCTNCDQPASGEAPTIRTTPVVAVTDGTPESKRPGLSLDVSQPTVTDRSHTPSVADESEEPPSAAGGHRDDASLPGMPASAVKAVPIAEEVDEESAETLQATGHLVPESAIAPAGTSIAPTPKQGANRWNLIAAAAAMVLVVGAGAVFSLARGNDPPGAALAEFTTATPQATTTEISEPEATSAPQTTADVNDALDRFVTCAAQSSISTGECQALVALYTTTEGPHWVNAGRWLYHPNPCTWDGVLCSGEKVTELQLSLNRLSGAIPAELGNLTNLTTLRLLYNQLSGAVPLELGNLTNLTELVLRGQGGCLTADDPVLRSWLASFDPLWNDGC